MKLVLKILSALVVAPVAVWLFFIGQMPLMEGYNLFQPYIDTEFAKDYSPEKFDLIKTGMNKSEVLNLIGKPLYQLPDTTDGRIFLRLVYTSDSFFSKAGNKNDHVLIGDFAWYRSTVFLDSAGKVAAIDKGWSYD